jgi:hypothetical protein
MYIVLAIAMFLLGLLLLFASGNIPYRHQSFKRKSESAQGVIVDIHRRGDSQMPVFEFIDTSGEKHRVIYHKEASRFGVGLHIGKSRTIFYDPNDPKKIVASYRVLEWIGVLFLALFGLLSIVIGLSILMTK